MQIVNCSFLFIETFSKSPFISSKEREPVPEDGVDHVRTARIVAEAFAEIAVEELGDDGVHRCGGEQLAD